MLVRDPSPWLVASLCSCLCSSCACSCVPWISSCLRARAPFVVLTLVFALACAFVHVRALDRALAPHPVSVWDCFRFLPQPLLMLILSIQILMHTLLLIHPVFVCLLLNFCTCSWPSAPLCARGPAIGPASGMRYGFFVDLVFLTVLLVGLPLRQVCSAVRAPPIVWGLCACASFVWAPLLVFSSHACVPAARFLLLAFSSLPGACDCSSSSFLMLVSTL